MGTYFAAHPIATYVTSMPKLLCRPEHVPLTDASTSKAPTPATTHWAAVAHVGDASLASIPEAVGSVAIHTPIFFFQLIFGPTAVLHVISCLSECQIYYLPRQHFCIKMVGVNCRKGLIREHLLLPLTPYAFACFHQLKKKKKVLLPTNASF